ncbi:LysR family transcriptional regulator [Tyzzerella sp. OttesenSCG-928-J15]|nr:LysR family transcriptional regulator [Tyzzerella sp. OttesenSCG-928-J15]
MDIQKLVYFVSMAETLSFTKSAQNNHVTQACMSQQISALERELGVTLFIRSNRNVELSPEGKEFYWHAQSILSSYKYAVESLTNMDGNKSTIRIGVGPYEHFLAQNVIEKFIEKYPGKRLTYMQYDYSTLSTQFRNGMLDVLFCINHCAEKVSCKEMIDIYTGDWLTVCSANSPLVNVANFSPADLNGQVLIRLEPGTFDNLSWESHRSDFKPAYSIITNTLAAKLSLTASGIGVSRVPGFVKSHLPKDVKTIGEPYYANRKFQCVYSEAAASQNDDLLPFINLVKEIYSGTVHVNF